MIEDEKMTGEILLSDDNLSDKQPVRKVLDGLSISLLPKVRTTDSFMVNWDRNSIVNQLLKETKNEHSNASSLT